MPPTPTPVPVVRVGSGDKALFNGDIETAMLQYRAAAQDATEPDVRVAALWGLARAQYADARYNDAIATLDQLIADYPQSPYAAPAAFLKGQSQMALQHYAEAASAYQVYLTGRPGVLDSYAQELRGDALGKLGQYQDALAAYSLAQSAPHLDDAQAIQVKMGETNAAMGDYDAAIGIFDAVATSTTNDYTRARMDYLAGQAYVSQGKTDLGYERFQHAVANYPRSYYSYQSLLLLVAANQQVSDLDRGLTDYFAGQYDVALTAFERYIAANPGEDGTAHFYRAFALDELQQWDKALEAFNFFIDHYPTYPDWATAWEEKSNIQWYRLNLYPEAAQTLLDYVARAPAAADASDELMAAARIYERDGRYDEAAATWERVGNEYPADSQAATALSFAGVMQYRQADYGAALPLFQKSLQLAVDPEDQARAHLWIAKTDQKLNDQNGAQLALQQAQNDDPGGYYSLRASDILMGAAPFTPPTTLNLQPDMAAERKAADAWVRLTFKLPAETDLSGLGTLASDARLIRGRELWNLGLLDEARLEFEDLRCELASLAAINCTSLARDPSAPALSEQTAGQLAVMTYSLSNFLISIGMYRSGIYAARQVLSLAGLTSQAQTMLAPPYFNHTRYGLYYSDLILPAAHQDGFDPLFLFSVIRQESQFEGFVNSTAGARGLMQIMPSTGADIAASLGWPINYNEDMLYRPNVSVAYGSHYLAAARKSAGGDLYAALAAYNGGLGNALEWKQLGQGDPDLFLESVRYEQTRQYIRYIYEIYTIYRRLYGS